MDQILLCTNHIPRTTLIHNSFIENYMTEANGDYVKVYLYLAKCIQYQESELSISSLADHMDNTEKDVIRALQYWEKRNLLLIERDPHTNCITSIDMLLPELPSKHVETNHTETDYTHGSSEALVSGQIRPMKDAVSDYTHVPTEALASGQIRPMENAMKDNTIDLANVQAESKINATDNNTKKISVSSATLKELATNEEFIWTCHVIESYLDRPMKPNETRLISYLYGTLHFSKDLLLYLYEYCISLGKTNQNYIQAVALSWDEQGVTTPEEAEKVSTAYNSAYNAVSKSLALGRALATVEKKCVDRWLHTWHMDLSVILEACNRTILKVHKADFKYIEGILDRWQQNGVHTLQDVEKADLAYAQNKKDTNGNTGSQLRNKAKNQFQNFQQRNTSTQEVDDLERRLLMR